MTNGRYTVGNQSGKSASIRIANLNGDQHLDLVVANGRHWPQPNYLFFNQGRGSFTVQRQIGLDGCTSYAAEPADLDGDGDVDLAIGNDRAPNQIFLNDGDGNFILSGTFGEPSSVRSLTISDLDQDGDPDILTTCRGRQNQIFLNDGSGQFPQSKEFGPEGSSTIDVAVVDWNLDGHLDLVLANRDSQANCILINDGDLNFETVIPLGASRSATRAVAVADLSGDGFADLVFGNIGQANEIYLADGEGGLGETVRFGSDGDATYCLAIADMDHNGSLDIVTGNVAAQNAVFLNKGDGTAFSVFAFGSSETATYGLDVGDLDGDTFPEVVVANSDSPNQIFLNRPGVAESNQKAVLSSVPLVESEPAVGSDSNGTASRWLPFDSSARRSVKGSTEFAISWNVSGNGDDETRVRWKAPVPGLGHSSPVIVGDRIFLLTAIAGDGVAPLQVGRGGQPDAADDQGEQSWVVLCYDRSSGKEVWRRIAKRDVPRATRHAKATHANTSVATDSENLVAFFGSEGLHCYDLDGNLRWSRDLGVINISKYGIGWGFASSPVIHDDRIVLVCDDPDNPFLAAFDLSDGKEIWRTSRRGVSERSWSTPLVQGDGAESQVVVNGWPWIVSYHLETGEERWRIRGGGDNPVPTPFEADGNIYVTNSHGAESPIFVVRPSATGDVTPPESTGTNDSVIWSTRRGGSYMSTPVIHSGYLYLGNTNGVIRCFDAKTGEKIYEKRLGTGASIYASLVSVDGKIYCASENGKVYVLQAGSEFKILAENQMSDPCFATPACMDGILYFRTTKQLIAIE